MVTRRVVVVLLLVLVGACQCGHAELVIAGNTVVVADNTLVITRSGEERWRTRASDIAFKRGSPVYFMEFGMFNIEEDPTPMTTADTLTVREVTDAVIAVDVIQAETVVAIMTITGDGDNVVIDVQSTADHNQLKLGTTCAANHHFIGLGAQTADVDHRGQRVPLWVSEQGIGKSDTNDLPLVWQVLGRRHSSHVPMPALVRSDGTAVVVDTSAFARFDLCATDEAMAAFEAWQPHLRVVMMARDSVREAQQALAGFTGRSRLLPPVVFAPWNDAIFGEDSVIEYAQFLRDQQIPSSVIWTEDWRGGSGAPVYRLDEDWRLDRALYPNYEAMVQQLAEQGFDHHVYFNTFVTEGGDVFDEVTEAGFAIRNDNGDTVLFTGADRDFSPTALLDLTSTAALTYMSTNHLQAALALGARGWMADFAEWMPVRSEDNTGVALADGSDPALTHNRYPELWQQLNLDAVSAAGRLEDTVLFYRSGHLRSPALVDVMWAGDQRTTFDDDDGLPTIIPIGIGTSTTGFDYFAHDIGGYQSSTNDPTSKALFFRWTELGAFSPVMRTHHGTHAALNENLRTDAENTAHFKRYAEIHMRLYPYLRALAVANHDDVDGVGAGLGPLPLWVPLPLLYPADDAIWSVKDEVLLGPSLLLTPVVTDNTVSRSIVLPSARFVAFPMPGSPAGSLGASATVLVGPGSFEVAAALGEIPVFVAAGGIVPLTSTPAQTLLVNDSLPDLRSTAGDRVVVVALGAAGRFQEEDGSLITLTGNGTTPPSGDVEVIGNGEVSGEGWTITLNNQPPTRTTALMVR
jgi:sulfoquinovosidase